MGRYSGLIASKGKDKPEEKGEEKNTRTSGQADKSPRGQADNAAGLGIPIDAKVAPDEEVMITAAAVSLLDDYTKSGNYKLSGSEKKRSATLLFTLQQDHFPKTNNIELLRTFINLGLEDWERNGEESKVYKVLHKVHSRSL